MNFHSQELAQCGKVIEIWFHGIVNKALKALHFLGDPVMSMTPFLRSYAYTLTTR